MEADKRIYYRRGYKYVLENDFSIQTNIFPEKDIVTKFVKLSTSGLLSIKYAYAWDGASGPTIDDKTNARGGLVHDAFYQLIRIGWLARSFKDAVDRELQRICIEDGMLSFRAWYYYQGVRLGGGKSSKPGYDPYPVLTAP